MKKNIYTVNLSRIVVGISLFFMLLNSSTIYAYYFPNVANVSLILGGLLAIYLMVATKYFTSTTAFYSLGLWSIIILLNSIIGGVNISAFYYILKYFCVFVLVSVSKRIGVNILDSFYGICKLLAVWAIGNYFLMNILSITGLPVMGSYTTWWGEQWNLYLGFLFKNTFGLIPIGNVAIERMHVPFSEPGVAQLFFNFGIFHCLFFNEKEINKFWCLLFALSVILTTSLTGYTIMAFMFGLYFIKEKKYIATILFGIVGAIILVLTVLEKLQSLSYLDRLSDYTYIFSNAIDNLPFGIGLGNSSILDHREDAYLHSGASFFSGLFTPLVYLGLFSVYFYYLLINAIKVINKKTLNRAAFAVLVTVTLLTEPLSFTTVFAIFFAYGIIYKNNFR